MFRARIPHRYPFRWIDTRVGDRARLRLTHGGGTTRGETSLPATFALEILAQGAMVVLGGGEDAEEAVLAAIDHAQLPSPEQPLRPGDTLEVEVRQARGLGRLRRLEAVLWRGDDAVATAQLTVARGMPERTGSKAV